MNMNYECSDLNNQYSLSIYELSRHLMRYALAVVQLMGLRLQLDGLQPQPRQDLG